MNPRQPGGRRPPPRGRPGSHPPPRVSGRLARPPVGAGVASADGDGADLAHYRETVAEGGGSAHEPDPLIGRTLGPCQVLEFIGSGNSGRVYRALHQRLAFEVALKVIPPGASGRERVLERFQREARVAARLNHPNVVRVYDVDEEQGSHYIIQELVRGESLDARVRRAGPLDEPAVVSLGRDLASGLASIHKAGVVHRDVKPENVILVGGDSPKLLDFGIAKDLGVDTGTAQDAMLGTPRFMAPEQAGPDKRLVGPPCDLYGLGATLWFALTGRAPMEPLSEEPLLSFLQRRASQPAPGIAQVRPGTSPGLSALLERLLSLDPTARPAAHELERALQALDQGLDTALLRPLTTPGASDGGGTQGTFEELPLVELLQGIEFNEKSGELEVHGEGITARVTFEQGQPHEASTSDGARGERAIRRLLDLSSGSFVLRRDVQVSGPRLIPISFTRIILDHHRQSDESERIPIPEEQEAAPVAPPADEPVTPALGSLRDRSSSTLKLKRSQTLEVTPTSDKFELAVERLLARACAPLPGDPFLGCTLGPFKVDRLLGIERGEHLYLGTHTEQRKRVVLRVLPFFGPRKEELKAVAERARAALAVQHPNLESCLGAGTGKDAFYAGYRPAHGPTLADELARRGPRDAYSPDEVCLLLGQAGLALQALHGRNLVHGHIAPHTVRLVGEERRPVLIEAGLARTPDAHRFLATAGQAPGAPGFTAPEVLDRGQLSPASDMFSLGCLAVTLLLGRVPDPADPQAALGVCQEEPVARLSALDIPAGLRTVLEKLCGRNPKRRYRNANEFLVDLAAFERGKPVQPFAAPSGAGERREDPELQALLERQRSRARRAWTMVLVVLLLDLALAAYVLRTWREARQVSLPEPFQGFKFDLQPPR